MHSSIPLLLTALAAILGPVFTYLGLRRSVAAERATAREQIAQAARSARAQLARDAEQNENHAAETLRDELRRDLERGRGEVMSLRTEVVSLRNEVIRCREELILERENSSRLRLAFSSISALIDRCVAAPSCPIRGSGILPPREEENTRRHRILTPPGGTALPHPKPIEE